MIWEKKNFRVSSEKSQVDVDALHEMLRKSYWAKHRSREACGEVCGNLPMLQSVQGAQGMGKCKQRPVAQATEKFRSRLPGFPSKGLKPV